MDFIKQQTCLEQLDLRYNYFSSAATTQIFSSLLESSCINTLEKLNLVESCNFSSDETCALFASFLDKALKLKECDIYKQKGQKEIKFELKVAKVDETGHIKITDKKTE